MNDAESTTGWGKINPGAPCKVLTIDLDRALAACEMSRVERRLYQYLREQSWGVVIRRGDQIQDSWPDPLPVEINLREVAELLGESYGQVRKAKSTLARDRLIVVAGSAVLINKDLDQVEPTRFPPGALNYARTAPVPAVPSVIPSVPATELTYPTLVASCVAICAESEVVDPEQVEAAVESAGSLGYSDTEIREAVRKAVKNPRPIGNLRRWIQVAMANRRIELGLDVIAPEHGTPQEHKQRPARGKAKRESYLEQVEKDVANASGLIQEWMKDG